MVSWYFFDIHRWEEGERERSFWKRKKCKRGSGVKNCPFRSSNLRYLLQCQASKLHAVETLHFVCLTSDNMASLICGQHSSSWSTKNCNETRKFWLNSKREGTQKRRSHNFVLFASHELWKKVRPKSHVCRIIIVYPNVFCCRCRGSHSIVCNSKW